MFKKFKRKIASLFIGRRDVELERLKAEEKKRFNEEYNALTDEDRAHPDYVLGVREYMWRKKHRCRTGDEREDCDNNYYRGKP